MKSDRKAGSKKQVQKVQQPAAQIQVMPAGYPKFLLILKNKIRHSQVKAALAVNQELVLLYWEIGQNIYKQQKKEGWGARIIERLARDLRQEFLTMKGFSPRNLKYMRAFAVAYGDYKFVQQFAAQIPWFHNCVILDKTKSKSERKFYISKTIKNGWSRDVLVHQIERHLHKRQGKALTNFPTTLPEPQSDLAQQLIKDPYVFDFLGITEKISERNLERALLNHLKEFLLELGIGFSFVGSQYHLAVENQDYYLDLLFYHLHLHCYIVIDLKISEFMPEYAGKMNFYLSAVDDLLCTETDNPSIGIILCKSKNRVIVEYALRNVRRPMGVAEYQLRPSLPRPLRGKLPSPKDLKEELRKVKST